MTWLRETWATLLEAARDWSNDNASRLAAALAYYSLLALAPLWVISVSVSSWVVGTERARELLRQDLLHLLGPHAAQAIEAALATARSPESGLLSGIVGAATLLFGASGLFFELQAALNAVWNVPQTTERGWLDELRHRFWSLVIVLGGALLLIALSGLSALTAGWGARLSRGLPGGEWLLQGATFAFSFVVISGLFALVFKYLPDVVVAWRDVGTGALMTALLFSIGKSLLGWYIGTAGVGSAYGAAGSVIVIVVWVYYSAQVVFLGAEFTQAHARRAGRAPRSRSEATRPVEARAR